MFRAHVLVIRRSKLHYTASGIITPIGGRLVHETVSKTSKHSGCRILTAFPLQQWLNYRASVLRHTCIASLANFTYVSGTNGGFGK